jgi:hypothetical protein
MELVEVKLRVLLNWKLNESECNLQATAFLHQGRNHPACNLFHSLFKGGLGKLAKTKLLKYIILHPYILYMYAKNCILSWKWNKYCIQYNLLVPPELKGPHEAASWYGRELNKLNEI